MEDFCGTHHCQSRKNCKTCRDTGPLGLEMRLQVFALFRTPGDAVDFVCPFGAPWDGLPADAPVDRRKVPCVHRGPELFRKACKSCSGRVQIAVFSCSVHDRCTVVKKVDAAITSCLECGEYKESGDDC